MPLFYFILKAGRRNVSDPEGQEFANEGAARQHAITAAKDLMRNREFQTRHWRIQVCDDYLLPIAEVPFVDVDETLDGFSKDSRLSVKMAARSSAAVNDAFAETSHSLNAVLDTFARADRILRLCSLPRPPVSPLQA